MRLTLRTLLAYLDDLLDSTETKEIGEKIQESKVAQELVDRINDVMRKRRLTAPEVDGPESGLDPNIVAEYLDNQLHTEQVVEAEKVFLESDLHLAEVAATQQILTLVLGEPIELNTQSCERLYALTLDLPDEIASEVQKSTSALNASKNVASDESSTSIESPTETITAPQPEAAPQKQQSFEEGIPDYLKRKPFLRRILLPATIVMGLLLWVALLGYDFYVTQGYDVNGLPGSGEQVASIDNPKTEQAEPIDSPTTTDNNKQPAETSDTTELPPQLPKDNGTTTSQPGPAVKPEVPVPDAKLKPPVVAVIPKLPPPPVKPPVVPLQKPVLAAATLKYVSKSGILLRHDQQADEWLMMPRRSLIDAGEQIASPSPFRSTIEVEGGLCTLTLFGHSSLQMTKPTTTTAWGLSIVEGRILLETSAPGKNFLKEGMVLRLSTGGTQWELRLSSPETICGIEIKRNQPNQVDQILSANAYTGNLYVVAGTAQLKDASGNNHKIVEGGFYSLTPGSQVPASKTTDKSKSSVSFPAWLEESNRAQSSIIRRSASRFEKEFDDNLTASNNLLPLILHNDPRIAEYSVKCLALMRNVSAMIDALERTEYKEARLAAIEGLRTWMGMTPNAAKLLNAELEKTISSTHLSSIRRLLWGYTKKDAYDRQISYQLVDWLNDDHISVRQLAIYNIQKLTGQINSYRAVATGKRRAVLIRKWEKHLESRGALLKK